MKTKCFAVAVPKGGSRAAILLLTAAMLVRTGVSAEPTAPAGTATPAPSPAPAGDAAAPAPPAGGEQTYGRFDLGRFNNQAASHYIVQGRAPVQRESYFFPPDPPPLGAPLRVLPPPVTGAPAPPEAAAFVNEPFYSALSLRLAAADLPRRLQSEINAYREAKVALQDELRAATVRLKDADPAAREAEMAGLGRMQTPRIVELENSARRLRTQLLRGGTYALFAGRGDWYEARSWRLESGDRGPKGRERLELEFQLVRAAAFYEDALSPAQQRLAREAAMELQADLQRADGVVPATPDPTVVFFSPDTARIKLPADLPGELAGRIAAYTSAKQRLKTELRETLIQVDAKGTEERLRTLTQLAAAQAPEFAALDNLAEEIRRGLAQVPDMPGPPVPPALPADLAARIAAYRGHKLELLRAVQTRLMQPDKTLGPASQLSWAQEQVAVFNRENAPRFAALKVEKDGIREALAAFVRDTGGGRGQKSVDDLLEEFESARQEQEVWEMYRDYRTAVLTPGLSPAQRRLLFDAAVETLALPLPGGEVPR